MRLLNSQTLKFQVFYTNIPAYAILSHTWGKEEDEVTFQDVCDGSGVNKAGYSKLTSCCTQAAADKLNFVWIDTCCIDKTNNVELTEAINSMFQWYKKSAICYGYLSDVSIPDGSMADQSALQNSRWFTRGWTFQELIAPTVMMFYDREWRSIGSRKNLKEILSTITRINVAVLSGRDLKLSSVAQIMSWAATRHTTRAEDIAYCLIGILGVSMPLLYGEGGEAAFIRLQEILMQRSDDQSLFAWRQRDGPAGHGLLATSPVSFEGSGHIIQSHDSGPKHSYGMTNRGLCIKLCSHVPVWAGIRIVDLQCEEKDPKLGSSHQIRLYLACMADGRFVRTRIHEFSPGKNAAEWLPQSWNKVLHSLNAGGKDRVYLKSDPKHDVRYRYASSRIETLPNQSAAELIEFYIPQLHLEASSLHRYARLCILGLEPDEPLQESWSNPLPEGITRWDPVLYDHAGKNPYELEVTIGSYYTRQKLRTMIEVPNLDVELRAITSGVRKSKNVGFECTLNGKDSVALIIHGLRDGFDSAINSAARTAVLNSKMSSWPLKLLCSLTGSLDIPVWQTSGPKCVSITLGLDSDNRPYVDILEHWGYISDRDYTTDYRKRKQDCLDKYLFRRVSWERNPLRKGISSRRIGKWDVKAQICQRDDSRPRDQEQAYNISISIDPVSPDIPDPIFSDRATVNTHGRATRLDGLVKSDRDTGDDQIWLANPRREAAVDLFADYSHSPPCKTYGGESKIQNWPHH
ncbi:Vegetative incompatibility protein [Lachnellula occidentalis]|uniref:Vegetative incompatibility protein n=1 Tax=Lachnellula occidentalis TaxID=215460 RepID=A0A8H8RF37_9HELO|nr:Vegetative incompatibility protein [Lachnellula occidentalis]